MSSALGSTDTGRSTQVYVTAVAAVAVLGYASAVAVSGLPTKLSWFAALLFVALLASVRRPEAVGSVQVSVSGVLQIAAIPLIGPVGAGLVAALPVVLDRKGMVKDVFNAAQRVLLVLGGSVAYSVAGGSTLGSGDEVGPVALAVHMGAATLAAAIVNAVLLAGVLQLSSAGSLRVIATNLIRQIIPDYLSYLVAGYLLATLWALGHMGWGAAVFFLPSLFVIQWGLQQYAVEWATRHQVLNPFVLALDQRRPGSELEARLGSGAATAIATSLALGPKDVDEITTAARIRDVGMLALDGAPAAIVRRDHAEATRTVLGSVTFLDEPLDLVAAHHERIDGQGGPHGTSGEDIPLGARVVAVADAWSAAVAGGSTRAAAVERCEELAGSALDVAGVAALRRALERDQLPEVERR